MGEVRAESGDSRRGKVKVVAEERESESVGERHGS